MGKFQVENSAKIFTLQGEKLKIDLCDSLRQQPFQRPTDRSNFTTSNSLKYYKEDTYLCGQSPVFFIMRYVDDLQWVRSELRIFQLFKQETSSYIKKGIVLSWI